MMENMCTTSGNCGKCGICLSVCPVYSILKEEQASPRAKIQLIKAYENKRFPSSVLLKELISKCLMCGSCAGICPSGVDHYSQFMEMRSELISNHGDRMEIRSLVYLLARQQRLRIGMGTARMGQKLLPNMVQKNYSLGNISLDRYPKLNRKPFRTAIPEEIVPDGEVRGTVMYFTGCATNFIFDQTGFATVNLLTSMGFTVITPKSQTCCSIPMLYHGGVDEARANIETNISCFDRDGCEAVIVDCPTCGSALKREFPMMMRRFGLDPEKAESIAVKTTDLMSFIHNHRELLDLPQNEFQTPEKITYHLPCHLKNSFTSAENLLRDIPGVEYIPARNATDCCGGGGTFFYEYPEISGIMATAKIDGAKETGANIWLTDCPVCRINLEGQLSTEDCIEMKHPAVYLSSLLRKRTEHNNG